MPSCFVPFCPSGTNNKKYKKGEIRPTQFNFPKSAKARRAWIKACRRDKVKVIYDLKICEEREFRSKNPEMTTKDGRRILINPTVCHLHFAPEDLLQRVAPDYLPDGSIRKNRIRNIINKLRNREKVVPKIFPWSSQQKQKTAKRRAPPKQRTNNVVSNAGESKNFSCLNDTPTPVTTIQNNLEDSELQADVALQLSLQLQDQEDDLQKESIVRPPEMLCAIYSLPDANPAELDDEAVSSKSCDNNTRDVALQLPLQHQDQILNSTEDLDSFYSRCLLCTCRPDATPHIEIFSEANNQLQLAEKIYKYLNFQIENDLPQRVCQSCVEKLDVTDELVTSSQRARIMLIQMKQHCGNINTAIEQDNMDFNNSETDLELDSLQPSIQRENIITEEIPMDVSDSNCLAEDFDQPADNLAAHSREATTCVTVCESSNKSGVAEKPKVLEFLEEIGNVGLNEEDFVKCSQCSQVIYKSYLAFHVKTNHGEMTPVPPEKVDKKTWQQREQDRRRQLILEPQNCTVCKKQFYSQVLDLHVCLRHKSQKTAELLETDPSCLMQCPSCPCMFFPEDMQGHITEEHPPTPNPGLKSRCIYCNLMVRYCDLDLHLDSKHGPNAWRRCIHCKKKVRNTQTDMEAHLFQEHSGGKLFLCKICDRRYAKTGKEQAHMQTFLSCKYKCPLKSCRKRFETLSSFKDHVIFFHAKIEEDMQAEIKEETENILENLKLFEDPECRNTFEDLENQDMDKNSKTMEMNENSEIHEIVEITVKEASDKDPTVIKIQEIPVPFDFKPVATKARPDYGGPVECDICMERVRHKWCLIKHKNQVHNMNLRFDCDKCWKNFKFMNNMLNHINNLHMPKDHECAICGEKFTKRNLTTHMIVHQKGAQPRKLLSKPLDPVRCAICNCGARSKYALVHHINSEHLNLMGEYLPYRCERCRKEFTTYKYLMQHHYTAHVPKLLCTYCGNMINRNTMASHLKMHVRARLSQ